MKVEWLRVAGSNLYWGANNSLIPFESHQSVFALVRRGSLEQLRFVAGAHGGPLLGREPHAGAVNAHSHVGQNHAGSHLPEHEVRSFSEKVFRGLY